MDTPLVSIIVPVFQAESFLEASVESILNQTLNNIEIILINDGSTDSSGILCDKIANADKRVKVIHKSNGGQSTARNVGIRTASGEYIGFMDNDDLLYPDMCNCLYENAKQHNADISCGSFIVKDSQQRLSHITHTNQKYIYDNFSGMEAYLKQEHMDLYVWTKLYKRDFIHKNQIYFEEGRSEEDWLFNHHAFCVATKTVMEDIPIYRYWERSDSTCHTLHKEALHRYLDDTYYRIMKIEDEIQSKYPDFVYLVKRQTIQACFRMLFIISKNQRKECEPYYSQIKHYLEKNHKIVIKENQYWGMSKVGVLVAIYTPASLYFIIKRIKHRHDIS